MDRLQIIGAPQSPLVWAVRMAAMEKGLDVEFVGGRPHTPDIVAIQPFGKIPVMKHGDFSLGESRAIALYIDAQSPAAPLVPRDLRAAARAEEWIMHFHTEFAPVMVLRYVVPYFFPAGPGGAPDRAVIDAALPALEKLVGILERRLEGRAFLAGDFSLADIFFAPTLHYANTLPEAARMIAAAPRVAGWLARLSARPAFKATFPPPLPERGAA